MLRKVLLASSGLALVVTVANARPNVILSPDKKSVMVMPGKLQIQLPSKASKKKTTWLSTTFAKNPEGIYFCCYGKAVTGPSAPNFDGYAFGMAEQFLPPKSASITTLAAGVGYVSGDKSVTLTLYSDNGSNSPGTELASGTGTSPTAFGDCCGVVTVSIPSTSLTAKTPYWVGITTTGANFNTAVYEDSDLVDYQTYISTTSDGGTSWDTGYPVMRYIPAIGVK